MTLGEIGPGADWAALVPDCWVLHDYFVGVHTITPDRHMHFRVLTPSFSTFAKADRHREECASEYPNCDVYWTTTVYRSSHPDEIGEYLARVEEMERERRAEGYS